MKKQKLNIYILISLLLGVAYMVYSAVYWSGALNFSGDVSEQIGSTLATMAVTPHLICVVIGVIFNGLGLFLRNRWFALTGAILYSVAIVLMPIYFMFVLVEAVLSYIGFATMNRKTNEWIDIDQGRPYHEKNTCIVCGKKKKVLEEFYYDMCQACAFEMKDNIKADLDDLAGFMEKCKDKDTQVSTDIIKTYIAKINHLEELRKIFPGFKKSLVEERKELSELLLKQQQL